MASIMKDGAEKLEGADGSVHIGMRQTRTDRHLDAPIQPICAGIRRRGTFGATCSGRTKRTRAGSSSRRA
jgi:hypothetical protein